MPPGRCPFCDFLWNRASKSKSKDHLRTAHAKLVTTEMLDGLRMLHGLRLYEFLDAYKEEMPPSLSPPPAVI